MESTSVITASITPIPSNPQVRILPFPHHSMLLLSNQPSEAKASTSSPHPCFLPNKPSWCSWTLFTLTGYGKWVWRVESRNLWVSFSQNASGSLIDRIHWSTDRVVGELRTLTLGKDATGWLHTRFTSLSCPCRSRSWPDLPSFPARFDALEWE